MKQIKSGNNQGNKSERVKVYVRIRPFNEDELKIGGETPFKSIDKKNNVLSIKMIFSQKYMLMMVYMIQNLLKTKYLISLLNL